MNTYLADDEEYSPTVPGQYTWPLANATGYYKAIYAGPLPPLKCDSSVPSGTQYQGCFVDARDDRLLDTDKLVLMEQGPDGMTGEVRVLGFLDDAGWVSRVFLVFGCAGVLSW